MAKNSKSAWQTKIEKAEKFLEKAHTSGDKVYTRYKDEREDLATQSAKRANLFYSNVNTLKESLFNSMPKPDVSRRHRGDFDDDPSRVAAIILQRGLEYEVAAAIDFKEAVGASILDRLVPGIGTVWVRFSVDTEGEEETLAPVAGSEKIWVDSVYWDEFLYEPARTWSKVGWVGRKLALGKDEMVERWGQEKADSVELVTNRGTLTPKQISEEKYCIYEIWDKRTKKVFFIAKGVDEPLEESPDPYGLAGFFPCPRPLIANPTTTALLPVTDYHIAQDQYIQLDILYARISMIVDAVKVAGVYDSASPEIGRMLQGQENKLIPVDNWAVFAERGGAKGMIDWYPVEQVVTVLQQLQQQFEHVKSVLYEVTGMSDIIRGASNQYETAAAQQIKAQFASVRLNGYQRDVAEFVTDILQIMGEMVVQLYSDEKLQMIVGNLSEPDMQFIQPAMELLRNDFMLQCKVSVQADSLVQADWALEKTQRMELMGYISQFLQSAVPAIEQNPSLGQLLLSLMKWTITGFRGSAEVEGIIDQQLDALVQASQQPKPPPPPSPEEQKMQMEQQKMQMEMQMDEQRMGMEEQKEMFSAQMKRAEFDAKLAYEEKKMQMDLMFMERKMAHEQMMMDMEMRMKEYELLMEQRMANVKLENQMAANESALAHKHEAHKMDLKAKEEKEESEPDEDD